MSYYEENPAEKLFRTSAPFVHLHTSPLESTVFYQEEKDRIAALNYLAISIFNSGCRLLAFSLMSNHFHFILMGYDTGVSQFWSEYRLLMDSYFNRHGRSGLFRKVEASLTPINNLVQLRTEIAYVIRNAFVVRKDIHVFADPWASGCLYFNPLFPHEGIPASALKGRSLREFIFSRSLTQVDSRIYVKNGMAQIWSFVDYKMVEAFFENARKYVHSVLKNVEAQVETAARYGEPLLLSDDELIPIVFRICKSQFHVARPADMNDADRKKLAVILKNEYRAPNKQVARMTGLSIFNVDSLFPLSKNAP